MTEKTKIWDLPTRLFHWLLVVLIGFLWFTGEQGVDWMVWHQRAGLTVLTLVLFRIGWGLWGSTTARFSHFLRGPRAAFAHARAFAGNRLRPEPGHNPLGAYAVVAFLLLLLVQTGTGLFANDDLFIEGPLYPLVSKDTSDRLTGIHYLNFNFVLALIALHVTVIFLYWLLRKDNLIKPMITGYKRGIAEQDARRLRFRHPLWAALTLGVAIGMVAGLLALPG